MADAVDALPKRSGKPKARILVGMHESPSEELRRLSGLPRSRPIDNKTANRSRKIVVGEFRDQLQVGLPTATDEESLRRLLAQIKSGDVEVRVHLRHRLHAKLYLCHRTDPAAPRVAYVGSSNMTVAGLREQGELNVDVVDGDATNKLADWFEDRWNDHLSAEAIPELVQALEESWASKKQLDPYLVYLKMAWHLSKEAREGLIEYGLPASMQNLLLDFQAAAVQIASRIVMQRGGAMIGDVVGLGKTLVGTAIARLLQEEQNYETLVICPKNLTAMWESYLHIHEVRGRVESLSMVHKNLVDAPRFRLVIIDESHNLRSEKRRDYGAIKDYIKANEPKVLLLTATPYNKKREDLSAQLALFIDPDTDLGIRPVRAIEEIGEAEFALICEGHTSSLNAFKKSEHLEDWQELMAQFLVRRTRSFVEKNYAKKDEGRRYLDFGSGKRFYFPQRVAKPVERDMAEDDPAAVMASDETLDDIGTLKLPRYRMYHYLDEDFSPESDEVKQLYTDLKTTASGNLAGFTRVMMFKRLSSSGPAFLATLRRHRLRNQVSLHALDHDRMVPIGSVDNSLWAAETDQDLEDSTEEGDPGLFPQEERSPASVYQQLEAKSPRAIRWAPPQMFTEEFSDDLRRDITTITKMLERFGEWVPDQDGKLAELENLLVNEHPEDKLLVFTEAADTAHYIVSQLQARGIAHVAVVTGDSEDPTALARRFSPSTNQEGGGLGGHSELRVLVSTDVLSEGQNLQDAHIVVNYDLPWAIVRLIQRAGRVDRIGQESKKVLVYSFLPAPSVDEAIELRRRIRDRLGENARLLGADESFFGDSKERSYIEGVFDETADEWQAAAKDVDPVSMAYEIWRKATEQHPEMAERVAKLPNLVYSTKAGTSEWGPGVLVHTQTVTGIDAFAFVGSDGEARSITPGKALVLAECEYATPPEKRLKDHHDLTAAALGGPLRTPPGKATGALQGIRGKVWNTLHNHMDTFTDNLLFTRDDLTAAHDAINEYPLRESAKQRLAQALKTRSVQDLAALVADLHKDGRLCLPPPAHTGQVDPTIVCTLGLRPPA